MTTAELDHIIELEAKATPGPWYRAPDVHIDEYGSKSLEISAYEYEGRHSLFEDTLAVFEIDNFSEYDADYVIALRNAAPVFIEAMQDNIKLRKKLLKWEEFAYRNGFE